MSDALLSSVFVLFTCDKCGTEHSVEVEEDFVLDDICPKNWLLLRSHIVGLETDIEVTFCNKCRHRVLVSLGFSSIKEYEAVVKVTAEAERRDDIKFLHAQGGVVSFGKRGPGVPELN